MENVVNRKDFIEAGRGLAGKTGIGQTWLPLWLHLEDTAEMMEYLYNSYLDDHQRSLIGQDLDLPENNDRVQDPAALVRLLGYVHDIGKASAFFRSRLREGMPDLPVIKGARSAVKSFPKDAQFQHAKSGAAILTLNGFSNQISGIAGAHHGQTLLKSLTPKNIQKRVEYQRNLFGLNSKEKTREIWQGRWQRLLTSILHQCGYSQPSDIPLISLPVQSMLSGLLIMADWIASDTDLFPLLPYSQTGENIDRRARTETALKKLKLTLAQSGNEDSKSCFKDMFGFSPNAMQKKAIEIVSQMEQPGLILIEDQMGRGKTEAALFCADRLMKTTHTKGALFALPTQATANGLLDRFHQWAQKESSGHNASFRLFHSSAQLNDEYLQIAQKAADADVDGLTVDEWFGKSKTGLLADFVLSTVDQPLMMALNHRHVQLRHLGLSGKTVIIDEVHAYDAYMNHYLHQMLLWLGYYQVPVILLSATLSSKSRAELVESYQTGLLRKDPATLPNSDWKTDARYPKITACTASGVECSIPDEETLDRTIQIEKIPVSNWNDLSETVSSILLKEMTEGGCAGVIVNTVGEAQRISSRLREVLPDTEVLLFHARFKAADRAQIEDKVLRSAGKNSTKAERKNCVIVGTQVLEQSLDLDFDMLITQLAPVDLLLQRIGRLHRHSFRNQNGSRPPGFRNPKAYILTAEDPETYPEIVYDPYILLQTDKNLSSEVCIPSQIPQLIESVYASIPETSAEKELFKKMMEEISKEKDSAEGGVIKKPEPGQAIQDQCLNGLMGIDTVNSTEKAQATVRDMEDTVSVLWLEGAGERKVHCDGQILSLDSPLGQQDIHNLMKNSISIRYKDAKDLITESRIDLKTTEWTKRVLLDQIMVIADIEGNVKAGDFVYHYDSFYGLVRSKAE